MPHHVRRETLSGPYPVARFDHRSDPSANSDLTWPFGRLDGFSYDDVRQTAYEIFFTACRSSPGFGGGRNPLSFYSSSSPPDGGGGGSSPRVVFGGGGGGGVVVTTPTSRMKRALGLKMVRRSPSRRMTLSGGGGIGSNPSSPVGGGASPAMAFTLPPGARPRRPMTSAEIMRQQMRVTEQSDNRLRKTLMRTLVGQMGRRAETIILPLELLRHLKPSEFNDTQEYHTWQKRQLKVLELGLLLHPSLPLESTSEPYAARLHHTLHSADSKPLDTSKSSDSMRSLCNSAVSLSWRSGAGSGAPTAEVCRWADGHPLNVHLYVALLRAVFDPRDETMVLDEVDELLELMRKTWATLGITRPVHNACFAWVLFHQYVSTAMVEPDLLCAAHAVLATDVAADAKRGVGGGGGGEAYAAVVAAVVGSVRGWAEERLTRYHEFFLRGTAGQIETLLPVALAAAKILGDDVAIVDDGGDGEKRRETVLVVVEDSGDRVDYYIRCSIKNAFRKMIENGKPKEEKTKLTSEVMVQLAKETEDLALKEKNCFSPILKKWHPIAAGVAAVTLHNCFGAVLRRFLGGVSALTNEAVEVLQRAGKLEKMLVQMVVEDSADCEDGGKSIVREMIPFEVDYFISNLLKMWIHERVDKGKECLSRAKETETWNPKSKSEPYAQSAVDLVKLAKETVEELFEIPIGITEGLAKDVAHALENLFQDYISFVMSCGSKQTYIPALRPLTRCSRDSKLSKLWKKAGPCGTNLEDPYQGGEGAPTADPRNSTSRGTQRIYIRINTLHYLLSHIHSLGKTLTLNVLAGGGGPYFEPTFSSAQSATQWASEVAAYRLVFLDAGPVFYEGLYMNDDVVGSRIRPTLRALKQSMTLMCAVLDDRAQAAAMREVMRASFDAFLMVLLAGGGCRAFDRTDHEAIVADFEGLKRVFCACGEGLIPEDVVEREAEAVEGVIGLMGQSTEQLIEDFCVVTCEASGLSLGLAAGGSGSASGPSRVKLPMPPTTGRWHCSDANTILRVLCHRSDRVANQFLKRNFQLAKRR